MKAAKPAQVLLVEDNPADVRLVREAFRNRKFHHELTVVPDGIEAISYLRREGRYADAQRPDLVLLDLNLPKKNGREVLREVKADEDLKRIPIVVLSSSASDRDVAECYGLMANGYVTKPTELDTFLGAIGSIEDFWLTVASLPNNSGVPVNRGSVGAEKGTGVETNTGTASSADKRTKYILTLSADPNWPDESLVPSPDVLEQELEHQLEQPIAIQARLRAYNQSASGARFYELETGRNVSATEIRDVLVRRLERSRDPCFLGVPIRVILSAPDGSVVSKGIAHPGPHR